MSYGKENFIKRNEDVTFNSSRGLGSLNDTFADGLTPAKEAAEDFGNPFNQSSFSETETNR